MIRRTTAFLLRVFTAVLVGALVLMGLAVWRLAEGPVDLDFLRGYATRTVETPEGPITFEVGRISLAWQVGEGPMRLVFDDVRATDSAGETVARVPAATVDLSVKRLISGTFVPTSIVLDEVALDVVISRDGLMSMLLPSADSDPSARFLPILVEQLLKEPNDRDAFGRLNEVRISAARLRIDDRTTGFVWEAPAARAVMLRDVVGVLVRARTELQAGEQTAVLDFSSVYSRNRERISARLAVENMRPALFAGASKELATLSWLDLPMSGRLQLEATGAGVIQSIRLDLQGGAGKVTIPGLFSEPRAVNSVALRAVANPAQHELQIERFDVAFDGPSATLQGRLIGRDKDFSIVGTAELRDVPMSRMAEFWPPAFAPGGRGWATANIFGGVLDRAAVEFSARGEVAAPDRLRIEAIDARMAYRDLTVRYMPDMIAATGVAGTARFDGKILRFETKAGQAGAISAPAARIDILGLDGSGPHRAEIEIDLVASAPDAMTFLEQRRLNVPRDVLFNPDRLKGEIAAKLSVAFPLVDALSLDQVAYSATATLRKFALARAIGDFNLTEGEAVLTVDPKSLAVKGRARIEGYLLDISWRENFEMRNPPRRRYDIRGTLPVAAVAKLGVVVPEKYATGPMMVDATYQVPTAGPADLTVRLGLAQTQLGLPELRWEKPAGAEARATVSTRFAGKSPTWFDIEGSSQGLAFKTRVDLAPDGSWNQINVARLAIGQSELSASVRKRGDTLAVDAKARTLELERLQSGVGSGSSGGGGPPLNLAFTFDIGQLLLKRGSIGALRGSATLRGEKITSADVRVGAGSALKITSTDGRRNVVASSDDLGGLLRSAGWVDGIVGGRLEVNGAIEDNLPGAPHRMVLALRDYRLVRTAPGRRVGNLNGVIDGLSSLGDPLAPFALLDMRFDRQGDLFTIRRGRTNNGSVGLSVTGTFNAANEAVRLEGTGVPAYVINSLLSNIPLIGDILTGGQGKGLFAVNFGVTGRIDNPKVSVNPVSMLAPGILRNLFGAGASEEENPGDRGKSTEPHNSGQTP